MTTKAAAGWSQAIEPSNESDTTNYWRAPPPLANLAVLDSKDQGAFMFKNELRREDYTLSADDETVLDAFGAFFRRECTIQRVRASAPLGFDADLYGLLVSMGAIEMAGIAPDAGGATLLQLALIAEEFGRALAPAPLLEAIVVRRTLFGASSAEAGKRAELIESGRSIPSFSALPLGAPGRHLHSTGAIADCVLGLREGALVLLEVEPARHVPNLGAGPLGWWDAGRQVKNTLVLAEGPQAAKLHAEAITLRRILTASALGGLADQATRIGVEFARTRTTKGVPIGSLQAISYPLTDATILAAAARNLARRAAWVHDNERAALGVLPVLASAQAARAASKATTISVHVQGGLGFDSASDIGWYSRVAKLWASHVHDPERDYAEIGQAAIARTLARTPAEGYV